MKHLWVWALTYCLLPFDLQGEALHGRVLFNALAVPGATVTATHAGRATTVVTDDDGAFALTNVADGVWTFRVEMRGFASETRTITLPLSAASADALTFTLTLQRYEEIVGRAPADPLLASALLSAPTAPVLATKNDDDPDVINGSSINGAASRYAQARAFGNNRPTLRPTYTGGFGAVLGNSAWNARPYTFGNSAAATPSYGDAQLSVALQGPLHIPWLIKYGPQTTLSLQHNVNHSATTQSALMPTAAQRAGDLSSSSVAVRDPLTGKPFVSNVIPANRISSQAAALLNYFPLPNATTASGANFQRATVSRTTSDAAQLGVTKTLTPRVTMGTSMSFRRTDTSSVNLFDFTDGRRQTSFDGGLTWNRRVTALMQMRATYQFSRSSLTTTPFFANRSNVSADAGITGNDQTPENWGPPSLLFADIADLRDGQYQRTVGYTHAVGLETSLRRNRHNFVFGGDAKLTTLRVASQPDARGTLSFTGAFTGSGLGDFLLGLPSTSAIAFGDTATHLRGMTYDLYVNDDLRLGAGFTLNAGVRWEFETTQTSPVRPDRRGIEPRVGVGWRPSLGSSLVLRANYGVYRNLGLYQPLALLLAQQPPSTRSFSVQSTSQTPLTLANPFPASIPIARTFDVDPGFRTATSQSWQLSAQKDLPASLTVTAAYIGDYGSQLMQATLPNTYPAGGVNPCATCRTGYVYLSSTGNSLRHAMQLTLRRRLYAGFTSTVQYTLAKATDDAASFSNASVAPGSLAIAQDWLNPDAERGPSSFDQRHLLTVQAQYTSGVGIAGGTLVDGFWGTLLKDWTITSQLSAGSGLPFTPVSFAAVSGTAVVGVRPSLTGISSAPVVSGSYANVAAFSAPASGTWGNAGRNSLRGPRQFSLDATLTRVFKLRGRLNLEWRVAATNVLNRVTFSAVNAVISSPQFGLPTSANQMRRIQTSLRLRF